MAGRLAYLGPAGTYSEEAAFRYSSSAEHVTYPSIPQVAAAVERAEVEEGIVPIENSLHGSVVDVLDFLIRTDRVRIRGELAIPVNNCLMVRPGTRPEEVRVVFSHPQPLGQCRAYLAENYPGIVPVASLSTASAVSDMMQSAEKAAAIAPKRAAALYGAEVIAEGIQDNPSNYTRFVVLAHSDHPRTGRDKTSIAFSFGTDASGLLYGVLGSFASRRLNLAKIESRPTGESLGRYIFLIDVEGHRTDPDVRAALDEVRAATSVFKVFGSYPRY